MILFMWNGNNTNYINHTTMKKNYYIILLFIVISIGCTEKDIETRRTTDIRIYTNSVLTRTSMHENKGSTCITWNEGDYIFVTAGEQSDLTYVASNTSNGITEFTPENTSLIVAEGETVHALYPREKFMYDESLPDTLLRVIYDNNRVIDKNNADTDFLYGTNKVVNNSVNLQFKHLLTFIKIILPRNKVEHISTIRLKSTAVMDYDQMYFSLNSGQFVGENPKYYIGSIDLTKAEKDENNVYINLSLLPQPENTTLYLTDWSVESTEIILSRTVPTGGLKAGYMYELDMRDDKIKLQGEQEKAALIDFFNATNGNSWTKNTNWGSETPLNQWHGISGYTNVTILSLSNNNLNGTIPESFALLLDHAVNINLATNYLHGTIPEAVKNHPRWNELGWDIILGQYPFGVETYNVTKTSPRSGFDFSKGNSNLFLEDKTITLMDGSQMQLMEFVGQNKITQILTHSRGFFDSPLNVSDQRINLHLDYEQKGLGTIIELEYYWDDPIGNEWIDFASSLPTKNLIFVDEKHEIDQIQNSVIPLNPETNVSPSVGSIFLVDSKGELVDHFLYIISEKEELEDWYCNKIDSVVRIYCGEPEEHPLYQREQYTSSDYSRDGEVISLQKATQGKGIDLIFLGEAFVDKDMDNGGLYEQKMKEAMEQYFAFEPYSTFRDRFNVYAVKVVSPNAEFQQGSRHRINESPDVCFEYVEKISGRNTGQPPMVSVIYNSIYAGRSYTQMFSDGSFVSFMMEGVNNVLNHEAGGHGFAKLLDEYVEEGYENQTLPQEGRNELDEVWQNWSWGANVDWRSNTTTVKWAHFLQDSRYEDEALGLYEGAYLYGYGAYRPTENSMMRYNDAPFNAPSREQIYKTIMQMSEGNSWSYNYEDFVQYDAVSRHAATSRSLQQPASAAQQEKWRKSHRPPVHVKGTWRDAMKQSRQVITPLR